MDSNVASNDKELSLFRRINLIFRFSYTLPFFLASLCGIVYSIPYDVPLYVSILIPFVVLLLAILVNFSNDYFDHMSGIDKHVTEQRLSAAKKDMLGSDLLKKIYWEGNQFDTGLVTERQGRLITFALMVLAVAFSIPVVMYGGYKVLIFGIVGLFITYFYTAPPINLGARGLGEISTAIAFFMMCFCSFYVATDVFDVDILVFSMMIGIIVGLMRVGDSMSSHEAHVMFNERSLSIRLGLDRTVVLIKVAIVLAYCLGAVLAVRNLLYLPLFLTLFLTTKLWRILSQKQENWQVKSIPFFFGFAFLTEVLFIVMTLVTIAFGGVTFL